MHTWSCPLSDQSPSLARRTVCLVTPQGPGHTNLYPGNIVLLSFCYCFHSCNTALIERAAPIFILPLLFPFCVVWIKHAKIIWQNHLAENPLLFICHLSRFVQTRKKASSNWFQGVLYLKSNEGWSRQKEKQYSKSGTLFPHWTQNNSPYHSAPSKGAQSVYSPSVPSTGYFNVCSQILSRQMKERAAPLRDGSPHTECMSDWLLSYQLNLNSKEER